MQKLKLGRAMEGNGRKEKEMKGSVGSVDRLWVWYQKQAWVMKWMCEWVEGLKRCHPIGRVRQESHGKDDHSRGMGEMADHSPLRGWSLDWVSFEDGGQTVWLGC